MKKIFLIIILLTSLNYGQSNLPLLFDSGRPIGEVLNDSLKAYWNMSSISDSYGANTLTNFGTVTFATGKVGNAGVFTAASNNYLGINDNANLSMGDVDFTISCWVYATAFTNAQNGVIGKYGSAGAREYAILWVNGTTPDAYACNISNDGTAAVTPFSTAEGLDSTWYFITMWYDKTKDSVYIQLNDGDIFQLAQSGGAYDGTTPLTIGRVTSTSVDWTGLIDEVSIWKRVLTPAERTYLYNSGAGRTYTAGKIQ